MSEKTAKAERREVQDNGQDTGQGPKVLNTIHLNILENGKVNVSGPITDPILVMDVLGQALQAIAQWQFQNKKNDSRIVKPSPGVIVPPNQRN